MVSYHIFAEQSPTRQPHLSTTCHDKWVPGSRQAMRVTPQRIATQSFTFIPANLGTKEDCKSGIKFKQLGSGGHSTQHGSQDTC